MSLCPRRAPYFRGSGWLTRPGQTPDTRPGQTPDTRPGQTPDTRPGLEVIFPSGGTQEKTQVNTELVIWGRKN